MLASSLFKHAVSLFLRLQSDSCCVTYRNGPSLVSHLDRRGWDDAEEERGIVVFLVGGSDIVLLFEAEAM
jgi:hypothetical protein